MIDVSDVNNITDKSLTPANDFVDMFVVSGEGELFYRTYHDGTDLHRLRSLSGRLIPFDISGGEGEYLAFCGFDDEIHVSDRRAIYIINFNEEDAYVDDIVTDNCIGHSMCCLSNTVYFMCNYPYPPYLIKMRDYSLIFSSNGEALIIDSKNDRSLITGMRFDVTHGLKISSLQYNDSYIYCCGQQNGRYSLQRIDPYTFKSEAIVRDNNYEIYSFVVGSDNKITFSGLRFSDGKNILATIDENGNVVVLDETGSNSFNLNRLQ